jgi:hypothetical protein
MSSLASPCSRGGFVFFLFLLFFFFFVVYINYKYNIVVSKCRSQSAGPVLGPGSAVNWS